METLNNITEESVNEEPIIIAELTENEDSETNEPQYSKTDVIDTILSDPKLCHFIGNLMEGKALEEIVPQLFPQKGNIDQRVIKEELDKLDIDSASAETFATDIHQLTQRFIDEGKASPELINILYKGLNATNAIKEAEEMGYIRGRNEKIEVLKKENQSLFNNTNSSNSERPRYTSILNSPRRSIWD